MADEINKQAKKMYTCDESKNWYNSKKTVQKIYSRIIPIVVSSAMIEIAQVKGQPLHQEVHIDDCMLLHVCAQKYNHGYLVHVHLLAPNEIL